MLAGGRPEDHGPHLPGGDYRARRLVGGPTIQHDRQRTGRQKFAAARPQNDPIRVVFCIDNMQIGGTELNAVRTAERLDRSRFELTVVCLQEDGPLRARYEAAGIEVIPLPLRTLAGSDTAKRGLQLTRFLKKRNAEVFHAHDIYSNIFGVAFARAAGISGVIASRRWWANRRSRGLRIANRLSYSLAHVVLANSESVANLLVEEGIPSNRVRVVPNFLEESAFVAINGSERAGLLREFGVPPDAQIIGSVSNLRPVKDHASLLKAFSSLPGPLRESTHVLLVGDGECRSQLEASARHLGIDDRVHFVGRRKNNPNLHHLFDVSVTNSISEASSNSILEAMAAGRPVVATNSGGNKDLVKHRENGLLVPVSDPGKLAEALADLLKKPDLCERLGSCGRSMAMSRFTPEASLKLLDRLYRGIARTQN